VNYTIEINNEAYFPEFIRLNTAWIVAHFAEEEVDRELARDPGKILRDGGYLFCAVEDGQVLGVAALFKISDDHFELARMAVNIHQRGRGIGRQLAEAAIAQAKLCHAKRITLVSNTILEAAIHLYRSLGFVTLHEGPHPDYARANIEMELRL